MNNENVHTSSVLLYATSVDSRSSAISALSRFKLEETSEDVADVVAKSNKAEAFLVDVSVDDGLKLVSGLADYI